MGGSSESGNFQAQVFGLELESSPVPVFELESENFDPWVSELERSQELEWDFR